MISLVNWMTIIFQIRHIWITLWTNNQSSTLGLCSPRWILRIIHFRECVLCIELKVVMELAKGWINRFALFVSAFELEKRCSSPKANTKVTVWTCHAVGSCSPRTSLFRNKCTNAASFAIILSHFILIKTPCEDIIEHGYGSAGGLCEHLKENQLLHWIIKIMVCF